MTQRERRAANREASREKVVLPKTRKSRRKKNGQEKKSKDS